MDGSVRGFRGWTAVRTFVRVASSTRAVSSRTGVTLPALFSTWADTSKSHAGEDVIRGRAEVIWSTSEMREDRQTRPTAINGRDDS